MSRRILTVCLLAVAAPAFAQSPRGPVVPPMMMPPTTAPSTAPTSQPEDVAAIKDVLTTYNAAVKAGDVATLEKSIVASAASQQKALALMTKLTTAGVNVYKASVAKFTEAGLTADRVERSSFPAGFPSMPVDSIDIKPDGDKASLVIKGPEPAAPLSMRKINGTWKLDGDSLLPPLTDKQIADQTMVLDAAIAAIDQTTADVTAGHFRGGDEVVVLMNHRVQKAVQAAQMKLIPMDDPAMMPPGGPAGPNGPTTAPAGPVAPPTAPQMP